MTDGGDADAPVGDFTLSVPATQKVVRGSSAALPVSIVRDPGFTGTVSISISAPLPGGVTADTPQIADPATSANVNLNAAAGATLGHATIQVHATSGSLVHDQSMDLLVADPPGTLDETFNAVGIATVQFASTSDSARAVAVQSDGKIVIAGTDSATHWALARFLDNGTLDNTFGNQGKYVGTQTGELNGVAIQANGRIVATGRSASADQLGLMRLTSAGALDSMFGTGGIVVINSAITSQSSGMAVKIQSDQKIVAAGASSQTAALFRFETTGALDSSFDGNGIATSPGGTTSKFNALAIQSDGSIIGAGSRTTSSAPDILVTRFNASGAADGAFGGAAGKSFDINGPDTGYGVEVDANGRILVGAYAGGGGLGSYAMLRLLGADGSLDTTFDGDGKHVDKPVGCQDAFFRSVQVQPDGKPIGVGYCNAGSQEHWPGLVVRLLTTGADDTGFASTGIFFLKPASPPPPKISHLLYASALLPDGRLVAVGNRGDSGWVVMRIWL